MKLRRNPILLWLVFGLIFTTLGLFFVSCEPVYLESSTLTSHSTAPAMGPNCGSCHGYPLKDTNHVYHLEKADGNEEMNGKITCLDCHSKSIQFTPYLAIDSVHEDVTGEKWGTLYHPNAKDTTNGGSLIRSLPLLQVDTYPQHRGIPMPNRPGAKPAFQEYVTGLAHLNSKVDVNFDSRISNPLKFKGDSASYNPTQESCSAIACHPGHKPYSWGSKVKGLPVLKSEEEVLP